MAFLTGFAHLPAFKFCGCITACPRRLPRSSRPIFGDARGFTFVAGRRRGRPVRGRCPSSSVRCLVAWLCMVKALGKTQNLTKTGEAHAREARIVEIFRPQIWTRANWQLLQTCVRDIARPLRPHPAGFEAFRGLPRPHSWGFRGLPRPPEASLMGFRGLLRPREASTKSQNPLA